jgi:hypothetical protein
MHMAAGVLAPFSVEKLLAELGDQPFSISTDASNHSEIKLFPVVIRQVRGLKAKV